MKGALLLSGNGINFPNSTNFTFHIRKMYLIVWMHYNPCLIKSLFHTRNLIPSHLLISLLCISDFFLSLRLFRSIFNIPKCLSLNKENHLSDPTFSFSYSFTSSSLQFILLEGLYIYLVCHPFFILYFPTHSLIHSNLT